MCSGTTCTCTCSAECAVAIVCVCVCVCCREMSSGGSYRALALSVFALLSVTLYTALVYAVWTLNTQNDNLEKQITELHQSIHGANPGSSEQVTIMDAPKRMVKREVIKCISQSLRVCQSPDIMQASFLTFAHFYLTTKLYKSA